MMSGVWHDQVQPAAALRTRETGGTVVTMLPTAERQSLPVGREREFGFSSSIFDLSGGRLRGFRRGVGVSGGNRRGEYQCVVGVQW